MLLQTPFVLSLNIAMFQFSPLCSIVHVIILPVPDSFVLFFGTNFSLCYFIHLLSCHWISQCSSVFLNKVPPPKEPYKAHFLLKGFDPISFPRQNISKALRFWTTPCRTVKCQCNEQTDNLAQHLLLDCSNTRDLVSCFVPTLPIDVSTIMKRNTINSFF